MSIGYFIAVSMTGKNSRYLVLADNPPELLSAPVGFDSHLEWPDRSGIAYFGDWMMQENQVWFFLVLLKIIFQPVQLIVGELSIRFNPGVAHRSRLSAREIETNEVISMTIKAVESGNARYSVCISCQKMFATEFASFIFGDVVIAD